MQFGMAPRGRHGPPCAVRLSRSPPCSREPPHHVSGYHWVFRAEGTTARLTLSDWASEDAPGGPAGQELIWNFICVRAYVAAEE